MVPARLGLPLGGARKVWVLSPRGERLREATSELAGGKLTFSVSPADQTLFYEIAAE
jgi:hypothetical protein